MCTNARFEISILCSNIAHPLEQRHSYTTQVKAFNNNLKLPSKSTQPFKNDTRSWRVKSRCETRERNEHVNLLLTHSLPLSLPLYVSLDFAFARARSPAFLQVVSRFALNANESLWPFTFPLARKLHSRASSSTRERDRERERRARERGQ